MSAVELFDEALDLLARRQMFAVSIIVGPDHHDELAALDGWPVTRSPRHLSFRGVPTFRAERANEASIVGRTPSGTTTRIPLSELLTSRPDGSPGRGTF